MRDLDVIIMGFSMNRQFPYLDQAGPTCTHILGIFKIAKTFGSINISAQKESLSLLWDGATVKGLAGGIYFRSR